MSDAASRRLAPFSTSFTPNIPELLSELKISLLVSTYQAGKICVISPRDDENLVILPRNFLYATAVEVKDEKLAVATSSSVVILKNEPRLAQSYPNQPDIHDALYLPQAEYFTGPLAIHGLHWSDRGLVAVNTSFSCLSFLGENNSFMPFWKPWFIDELRPEDRCHLNGMVCQNGSPTHVTTFNTSNNPGSSWRSGDYLDGQLISVEANRPVVTGLRMPHSPMFTDHDTLLLVESAAGTLVEIDTKEGKSRELKKLDGFLRGMDSYQDFLFIGESKIRQNSSTFKNMEIAKTAKSAGVYVLHQPTMSVVGKITFNSSVDEIYDVKVLPGKMRPNILNTEKDIHHRAISFPGGAAWIVPNDSVPTGHGTNPREPIPGDSSGDSEDSGTST